jgi:diguanylate cyclase
MISLSDLTPAQRGLLAVGGAVLMGMLIALLAASDFDLSTFRTVRAENYSGGGSVIETRYNPLGILGLAVLGITVLALLGLLVAWLAPILTGATSGRPGGITGDAVAKAGQKLERELSNVLALVRGQIATNDSYSKSLATAQTRLSGLTETDQVRVIVSLLVAENERMRRDTDELRSKLEDSKKQIESLRQSLSHAEETVLQDPLTGTGNRRRFDSSMERAILDSKQTKKPLSLVMCDIDHFKRVNDAFGHQVGDEIIKMFARVIEASVREGDTVIRYGGEEFAIILPSADQDAARSIAERIRRQFESKKLTIRETNQKVGQLTASFGVAQFRLGDDLDTLVQRADAKLYEAKSGGRNRVAAFGQID